MAFSDYCTADCGCYEPCRSAREAKSERMLAALNDDVAPRHIPRLAALMQSEGPVLRQFATGAVRDSDADATRYDLIAPLALERLARTYAEGAAKYSDWNWRAGMDFQTTANHALRHVFKWLALDESEDHLAHAAWGLLALMQFECECREDLDNRFRVAK